MTRSTVEIPIERSTDWKQIDAADLTDFLIRARSILGEQLYKRIFIWDAMDEARLCALAMDPSLSLKKTLGDIRNSDTGKLAREHAIDVYKCRLQAVHNHELAKVMLLARCIECDS